MVRVVVDEIPMVVRWGRGDDVDVGDEWEEVMRRNDVVDEARAPAGRVAGCGAVAITRKATIGDQEAVLLAEVDQRGAVGVAGLVGGDPRGERRGVQSVEVQVLVRWKCDAVI